MTKNRAETPMGSGERPAPPPPRGGGRAIRLKSMDDVRVEMARVYTDARQKRLEPQEASKLVYILSRIGMVIEGSALEKRISELEKRA